MPSPSVMNRVKEDEERPAAARTNSLRKLSPKPIDFKPSDVILPRMIGTDLTRYLHFHFFTTYRKIFSVIFTANIIAFFFFISKANGVPRARDVMTAASANLMVAMLFRQELFVNLLYETATCVPHSFPLFIRQRLAKVYHYGGAHSGSATAAVVWFLFYTGLITRMYVLDQTTENLANIVMSFALVAMFIVILVTAHPRFRYFFHDYFEAGHRFAGWIAVATFWAHGGLRAKYMANQAGIPIASFLVKSPNFWFFCISTACSVISWLQLRRRDVYPEILSNHAIRLHFKYRTIKPFYGIKFSDRPLYEWHAFATIPEKDDNGHVIGFSIVVSNAGDWTKRTITDPPTKLWTRGFPLHGVLYTSRLFKRIVVVATGSGIGPCLSLFTAKSTACRILWSTPNPESTYGPEIVQSVLEADPDAVVWNTKTLGRPDLISLTYWLVQQSQAEAVFTISNRAATKEVVYAMNTRGIAAYGAIFDS
ncbi:hypothetical protein CVT26_007503 [Gymnopilus dilepis]|uniref:FAD-binding FR-type domain-containing protein n=1 Tax=Gymnopilus dilepis TaxID=231916 RepID=A0A409YSN7_9AGAR|nr:hypothetical protein CVT26_007503 [Gymnopilus dilepis]